MIGINEFYSVYDRVRPLSAYWEQIAISLRLRIDTINSIEANFSGKDLSCLRKVLEYWLKKVYDYKTNGIPCWRRVCVAVKEGGGDPALADEIACEHPLPATTGGATPHPLPATTGGATPYSVDGPTDAIHSPSSSSTAKMSPSYEQALSPGNSSDTNPGRKTRKKCYTI